jgi:uncharacterized repeat protein (TIGR03803 family)
MCFLQKLMIGKWATRFFGRSEMLTPRYPAQRVRRAEIINLLTAAIVAFGIVSAVPARAQDGILYSFNYPAFSFVGCSPNSGAVSPSAGVVFYKGHVYGTSPEGGKGAKKISDSDEGMVFRVNPNTFAFNNLHSFVPDSSLEDGLFPCSGLIENHGVLTGTTLYGGNGIGTIYSLTPPATGETAWTETINYTFRAESDGAEPFGDLVQGGNGALYGVTREGLESINAPAVFQFLDGQITQLTKSSDCTNPKAPCVYNGHLLLQASTGSLFGTTSNGGAYGYGNVFELTPSGGNWSYADLYDFTGGNDGATPNGALVGGAGDLFGTTQSGGGPYDAGVLFELRQEIEGDPLYTLIVQHTFIANFDGDLPMAGLYKDSSGNLWGTTCFGGGQPLSDNNNNGTIFELVPSPTVVHEWTYYQAYTFNGSPDGQCPSSLLTEGPDGTFYGTTADGGTAYQGTVFAFYP